MNLLEEQVEPLREDIYIEDMYGTTSRLKSEEWIDKMCKEGKWLLDSSEIRKRLFEAAQFEMRHF